jgi:hypothetical protein
MTISIWKRIVLAMGTVVVAAALSPQAKATIIYSICSSGCSQSGSSSTFALANLSGGVYTDPTTLTTFSNATVDNSNHLTSNSTTITPGANVAALGVDTAGGIVKITFGGNDYFLSSGSFFGIYTSDGTPLTSGFTVAPFSGSNPITLSDFGTGNAAPADTSTPEPTTFLSFGGGLIALGYLHRRSRIRRITA